MNIKYITNFCFCLFFLSTSLFSVSCKPGNMCLGDSWETDFLLTFDSQLCTCEKCSTFEGTTVSTSCKQVGYSGCHTGPSECDFDPKNHLKWTCKPSSDACTCYEIDLNGNTCSECAKCSNGDCLIEPTMCTDPCTECKEIEIMFGLSIYKCMNKADNTDCREDPSNPCTMSTCQNGQCISAYATNKEPPPVGSCPENNCADGICLNGQCSKLLDKCINNNKCTFGYCEVDTCRTLDLKQYNCCEHVNDCQNFPKRKVPNPSNPSQRIEIDDMCYKPTCNAELNRCSYIPEKQHDCCSEKADCEPYQNDCFDWECVISENDPTPLPLDQAADGTTGVCWHEKISEDCCTIDENCKPEGDTRGMTWWCDNDLCKHEYKDLSCTIDDDCRPHKLACMDYFCDLDAEDTIEGEGICRELAYSSDCDPCTPLKLTGNMTRTENNYEKCEVYLSWVVPYVDNEDPHFCDEIRFFDVKIQDQRRKWINIENIPYNPVLNDQSNERIQTLTGEYVSCWPDQHDFKVVTKDIRHNNLAFDRATFTLEE